VTHRKCLASRKGAKKGRATIIPEGRNEAKRNSCMKCGHFKLIKGTANNNGNKMKEERSVNGTSCGERDMSKCM